MQLHILIMDYRIEMLLVVRVYWCFFIPFFHVKDFLMKEFAGKEIDTYIILLLHA